MEQDIVNYINEARAHGLSDLEIKKNLLAAGWEAETVEGGFTHQKALEHKPFSNADEDVSLIQSHPKERTVQPLAQPVTNSHIQPTDLTEAKIPSAASVFFRKTAVWLSMLGILLVAGGASAGYYFWYASPERVWEKFSLASKDKIVSSDFKFAYKDKAKPANEELPGFPLNNISLEFDGQAYADASDEQNPQSSSMVSYSFSSDSTKFSSDFEYKMLGKKLYFNLGHNPFSETVFSQFAPDQKVEWIVFDLEELQKKSDVDATLETQKLQEIFNPQYTEEIKNIWSDAGLVKMEKSLGREKVGGKSTLHFANSLDKEALKKALFATLDKTIEPLKKQSPDEIKNEEIEIAKTFISGLVDKLEVKEFETWIGISDSRLYKIKFTSNAPSLISLITATTLDSAQGKSRDAKRLADARLMASGLELYYNDNSHYPESDKGQPIWLTQDYIGLLPAAPEPADGNCTDYFNTYWYEVKNAGQSYEMSFCLGEETGGYAPGITKLSPSGIQHVTNCPSTPENCFKPATAELTKEEEIKQNINNISFAAELNFETTYSDYGIKKDIQSPEGAVDILELSLAKSRDDKRLSDMRQIASALEIHYNDKATYPENLKDLVPAYFGILPEAPLPQDGACTLEQNQYTYKKLDQGKFEFTFCLGANTGGYEAGPKTLTEYGIK